MFDFGLTKLIVIGVVALIVLGPDKLPHIARTFGTLFGRAQKYIHQIKEEVAREIAIDEWRQFQSQLIQKKESAEQFIENNLNLDADDFISDKKLKETAYSPHLTQSKLKLKKSWSSQITTRPLRFNRRHTALRTPLKKTSYSSSFKNSLKKLKE